MKKFNFPQNLNGNGQTVRFNTLSSDFGDGYSQSMTVGLNNRKSEYQYAKTDKKALILQIKAFFDEHKGAKPFLWDSPLDGEITVKTGEYTLQYLGADVWTISTTFTQVFYR